VKLICEQEKLSVMLSSITWGQYLSSIALLLLFYYGYVAFRYYKWEILGVIGIKKIDGNSVAIPSMAEFKSSMESESHDNYLPKPATDIDISPLVQSFTDEVQAYIQEAESGIDKDELLYSLKLIATKYPVLKNADCSDEMSQFIYREANNRYPNIIQPNDALHLWQ
jgi:hypothetical protein